MVSGYVSAHYFSALARGTIDVLGGFASVITVLQISKKLFDISQEYFLEVKDPRKDIQRFCDEVNTFLAFGVS